ncbi:UNVERIFIED_CONTAM: hypothetical protein Sradi_6928700 [Sesamum radiatum]|uniref:Reverse transcriptase n=1 Tax=Sesamum radiatum TaxID=300843 RepID=A0AAW2JJ28_SESRA
MDLSMVFSKEAEVLDKVTLCHPIYLFWLWKYGAPLSDIEFNEQPISNTIGNARKLASRIFVLLMIVLLFCKADLPSIQVLRDTLTEFAALSGLNVNPAKSQIILSRAVQQERRQIVEYLGFQEGSLPVRYLGVPLTSSRLTIADCRPLINRIDTRLAGWNQHNLSYAGRVQLIKSVLSSFHTYWASVFITTEYYGLRPTSGSSFVRFGDSFNFSDFARFY